MNKDQKIIASGFMRSVKHKPRKNGIFITYVGMPSFHQTGDINKKFCLIIEEEKEE